MADKFPTANDVWSNAANWNGGTLPQAGDDVYADGKTITIDQDVTVATIRNTQRSGGTNGGGFILNATRTINCTTIIGNNTASCVVFSAVTPNAAAINANITGGTAGGLNTVAQTGTGSLTITGNITGGTGAHGVGLAAAGTLNVIGNITGGVASGGQNVNGLNISVAGIVTVTGNVTGGPTVSSNHASGIGIVAGVNATLTVTGTVSGADGGLGQNHGIDQGGGTVTVNGNVFAGGGSVNSNGLRNSSTAGVVTVTMINGDVTASATSNGITVNANAAARLTVFGNLQCSTNGRAAVGTGIFTIHTTAAVIHRYRTQSGGSISAERSLGTSNSTVASDFQPDEDDVREGTVYASTRTGTLAVPPPSSVGVGVPTDNTVGTAAVTASAIRDAVGLVVANLDTQLANIHNKTTNLPASPAAVGSAMTLTTGERTAVANEVEAQIIDDTDSEKVLIAITDKIASVNPSLDDLTLASIAAAVRDELLDPWLNFIDAAVSSRSSLTQADIRTALGMLAANLDSQLDLLAAADDVSATAIRAAVGLATANLDTQLIAIDERTENLPDAPAAVGSEMTLAAVEDVYHADVQLTQDNANSRDEWTTIWFRNANGQTTGVTVPTIQVVRRSDGTDLVAEVAMDPIGATGAFKYDEATNRLTAGEAALVIVRATINGGTRTGYKVITRDSAEE